MPAKDFDAKDLHAMLKESECTEEQKKSPEDLYASLKRHPPHTGKHIRKAENADFWSGGQLDTTGVYKIDKEWFGKLPLLDWRHIFVYGDKDQQGYKMKGGQRPVATADALKGLGSLFTAQRPRFALYSRLASTSFAATAGIEAKSYSVVRGNFATCSSNGSENDSLLLV